MQLKSAAPVSYPFCGNISLAMAGEAFLILLQRTLAQLGGF
jgi:hypothetical protein